MNLQYIYDNSTTPPTQSVLQYKVDPDTVFVSTATQQMYANLTITVFNPSQQPVICQAFQFGFYVGAQYGDLTAEATGIQTSSDQTSWTISKQATESPDQPALYQFSAPATGTANFQLAPQQSLVFHLNGILINNAVGEGGTAIAITEVTGASFNAVNGEITVSKALPTFSIEQFTASPPTPISPGAALTLNWQTTGSDHQQLYNENTGVLLYDSATGSPPNAHSYTDNPERNTTYELIAWAGQLFTVQQANAMVNAPQFIPPEPYATPPSVNPGAQTTLYWNTVHADTVTITAPGFTTQSVPASRGQYTISSVTTQTTYTLTASAAGTSATDNYQVTVEVNLPAPSVTSFTSTPVLSNPDGAVTLSWETAYTTSADLQQQVLGSSISNDLGTVPTNQSTYTATPTGISKYTLKVFGQGGQSQGSVIAAQQQVIPIVSGAGQATAAMIQAKGRVAIPTRGMACDLIYDGANIWVADWASAVLIEASNGNVLGYFPATNPSPIYTPWALACLPNAGSVFVLSQNDCYVIKLQTANGSLSGAYSASPFTQPVNFPSGYAIAVDQHYIWVAYVLQINPNPGNPDVPLQYNGAYVSQLDINTGAILNPGQYQLAGPSTQLIPTSIASDGSNVWVASGSGLTKLSASDGTILGTYLQQSYPQYVVFDGSHIWASCADGTVKQLDSGGNVLKSLQATSSIQPAMGKPLIAQGAVCVSTGVYDPNTGSYTQALQLLQTSDGTQLASLTILPYFTSCAFDGACFWLLARNGDNTSVSAIKI